MRIVNIHEAKTHLSRLVKAATKGEPFIIAKAGKPLVKVVPLEEEEPKAQGCVRRRTLAYLTPKSSASTAFAARSCARAFGWTS